MATLNFPDNPSTGDTYTDSNSGFTYEWNGTVWISKDPSTASNIRELDNISGSFNGSTTQFNLTVASVAVEPANVQQLIISVGGVMQNAGDDYTVSGSTITFTTAPTSGLTFFGTLLGTALSLNTIADGSVTVSSLSTTTNYIMGGLTADQNAGIITSYGLVAGAGGVNVSGAVTGGSFSGDGSGLTGVASTDNIITSYGATFLSNVRIAGVLTAANAYVTGILTAQTLNYNNVVDIYSTGIITATRGIQQTGNEGLHVSSGITTVGIFTATSARVGLGVTINNTGIDAGIGAGIITAKTYYGDATNMTGAGSTFQVLTTDPFKGKEIQYANFDNTKLVIGFNHGIAAGNADKEVELRETSATGTIVQSFGVGSSVTYNAGQAIVEPTSGVLTNEKTFFLVVPAGAFKKIGTATSNTVFNDYSFTTVAFTRNIFATGQSTYGILGNNIGSPNQRQSSPLQIGSGSNFAFASPKKSDGINAFWMKRESEDNYSLWMLGAMGANGQSGLNIGGSNVNRSSPTQVGTDTNWANVSQGNGHTLASKTDGTLWTWGYGDDGALGLGIGNARRSSPTQVGTDTTWTSYHVCGEYWNCAIKTDGTLWSWGAGQNGRPLGQNQGSFLGESSPKQVGTDTTWAKMHTSSTNGMQMYAIKTDNTMWVWGQNYRGLLGLNQTDNLQISSPTQLPGTNWNAVSSGGYNQAVMATKSDGTLWAWGDNAHAQCGKNMTTSGFSSPAQIPGDWNQGRGDRVFATGGDMSVAVKTDGTIWSWGNNGGGQLGDLTTNSRSSPIQVGTNTDWSGGNALGQGNDASMYFFAKSTN